MFASLFSPLAPAAVLLLGAFILSVVFPRLPDRWRTNRLVADFGASILVGLAILTVLGTRLAVETETLAEELELLSGWNFSTIESVAALTIRADLLSLSFLTLTLLILLALTLAISASPARTTGMAAGLALGGAACLLFVAANGLTISYAILIFDFVAMVYWLPRGQTNLAVARLFLAVFTAGGLALTSLDVTAGNVLLGLALWLRLGLYPLIETVRLVPGKATKEYGYLVQLVLSLTVGMYLVIRVWPGPLPELLLWLAGLTMLLGGSLAWLANERSTLLLPLIIVETLLLLLAEPLAEGAAVAYVLGLMLSLVALWLTPERGKPQINERGWLWPYLPAAAATLTVIGVPLSLNWPARSHIYQSIVDSRNIAFVILIVLAEGLALSSLVSYWLLLWERKAENGVQAVAAIVIMVPFLIPGLAPYILSTLTKTDLPTTDVDLPPAILMTLVIIVALAVTFGYYKPQIMSRLGLARDSLAEFDELLVAAWRQGIALLDRVSKIILRIEVLLQGQHYMGWALFTALVGVVIILLGT